jgi:hypothetical protein
MSRPHLANLERRIALLGTDEIEGEDVIFERIASGENIGRIAQSLNVSRSMLYVWRDHLPHKERRQEKWEAARKLSAEALIETADTVLDALAETRDVTPAQVSIGRERVSLLKWRAGVMDRETYGDKSGGTINVQNLNILHLEALQRLGNMKPAALPAPTEDMEAEVV